MDIRQIFRKAIAQYAHETKDLEFFAENRYNTAIFPTTGQYDWFSAQVLYCLVRYCKPRRILEISTASGYATLFMAMALKRNDWGKIDTHEVDAKAARAARKLFKAYDADHFVECHSGDARKTSLHAARDYAIYFLDSLHTEEFAKWFLERHVLRSDRIDALFHMHDILPLHARVRRWGAPPFTGTDLDPERDKKKNGISTRLKNLLPFPNSSETKDIPNVPIQIFPPERNKTLETFNGNCTTEALFGNKLAAMINPNDQVFLYDLVQDYPELSPGKYHHIAVGRTDSDNRPMEWNESWWCTASEVKRAYLQTTNSLFPPENK